ncbi:MAG: ECF transporter S component [Oscillospiraceae bacterium]|jgi:uncharacterized membrane protein|nr:ECF transporter S component [Oscillospiraceae bacterium]
MRVTTKSLAVSGLLAALTAVATMALKVPVPATSGYVHLGDTIILFSALLLGPAAAPIGGVGSALADLLGGYGQYVLPTLVIKAVVGLVAGRWGRLSGKGALGRSAVAFAAAQTLMALGYWAFECLYYTPGAAWVALGPNLLQGLFSAMLALALLPVARRVAPMLAPGGRPK